MAKFGIIIFALVILSVCAPAPAFMVKIAEKAIDIPSYDIRGTEYLPLALVCDAYGIRWEWDPVSRTVELNKDNAKLRLRVGEYKVYANGVASVQEKPVIFHRGAVCVPSNFLRAVFNKIFIEAPTGHYEAPPAPSFYKIKMVVLDAGHGGYDPGAIGRDGIKEKYIVMDITKKIKEMLEAEGVEVILTRWDDRYVPLWRRVDVANDKKVDLFISIHANASRTRGLKGFEVYYLSEAIDDEARATAVAKDNVMKVNGEPVYADSNTLNAILWDLELTENRRDSIELAKSILGEVESGKERLKSARFYVLKGVIAPAVLVEVGYISNTDECSKLGRGDYRGKIAEQITSGILEYKRRFEG